jgi:hypothetical protein
MRPEAVRIILRSGIAMESAESPPPAIHDATIPSRRPARPRLAGVSAVVLQVDGTVSRLNGLAWLGAQRNEATLRRLSELQVDGMAAGWSPADFARARIAILRPRRAELNELSRAYLESLASGVVDVAHRIRRAGLDLMLAGEVAVEALFGVADALGVVPADIRAPHIRFDALGAYAGCEVDRSTADAREGGSGGSCGGRLFVGTRQTESLVDQRRDSFVRYTGFVAHERSFTGESVASFAELAELVTV